MYYNILMKRIRIIFEDHSNKHGLTPEDIAYAVENPIRTEEMEYKGVLYIRLTGKHNDVLMQSIGIVMKIEKNTLRIYHAGSGEKSFWDLPFDDWIKRYRVK